MRASHTVACAVLFIQTLYFFDVIEIVIEPSSGLNRLIMFSSLAIAAVLALIKLPITLQVARVAWPVFPLILWFWMTSFWSDMPDLVRQRSVAFAVAYISALGLAIGMRSPRGFVVTLFFAGSVVIIANVISLAFPSVSSSEIGIKGIHVHKNVAGFVAIMCGTIIAFTVTQTRSKGMRFIAVVMALLAFGFLILTKSKTNFFVLAVLISMMPVYFLLVRGKEAKPHLIALTCVLCGAFFLLGASGSKLSALGALYGDPTLTNRAVIWVEVEAFIAQAPWRGIGFGSFWDTGGEWNRFPVSYYVFYNDPKVVNLSHNGYLDILLHGGRVALVLACIVTAQVLCYTLMLATSKNVQRSHKWLFCLLQGLIIMIMVQNLTESSIYFPSSSASYFFLILLAQAMRWKIDLGMPKKKLVGLTGS